MKLVSECKQYIEKSFRKIYTATRTKEDIKDESEGRKPESRDPGDHQQDAEYGEIETARLPIKAGGLFSLKKYWAFLQKGMDLSVLWNIIKITDSATIFGICFVFIYVQLAGLLL